MAVPRAKHQAFAEEDEYRLIPIVGHPEQRKVVHYRPTSRGLVPYLPLTLAADNRLLEVQHVYVGPTQDPDSGSAATIGFLDKLGYSGKGLAPDHGPLRAALIAEFRGKEWVTIEQLQEFVASDKTPYHTGQLKTPVLVPLEKEGGLEIDSTSRQRRYAFTPGTRMRFL